MFTYKKNSHRFYLGQKNLLGVSDVVFTDRDLNFKAELFKLL